MRSGVRGPIGNREPTDAEHFNKPAIEVTPAGLLLAVLLNDVLRPVAGRRSRRCGLLQNTVLRTRLRLAPRLSAPRPSSGVVDQEPWRLTPGRRLPDLLLHPVQRRRSRYVHVDDPARRDLHHHEDMHDVEKRGVPGEKIAGPHLACVIRHEPAPALVAPCWSRSTRDHVLPHCATRVVDAELVQQSRSTSRVSRHDRASELDDWDCVDVLVDEESFSQAVAE